MDPQTWQISDAVRTLTDELISLRRDLHAHPELAHQEHRTQQVVLEHLRKSGIESRPFGGTGVVGIIQGKASGPVLLLRADMDALPIQEEAEVPFASQIPGVMHACGHDAHTAMLLTAARILAANPPDRGTIKLMFQPAEEGGAGASPMIAAGVLEDPQVDAALAIHVWSLLPVGQVALIPGAAMASVDSFRLRVIGNGTHAATPEDGIDPIAIAAQIVTSAQALVARRRPPYQPAVLSFTSVHGGTTYNVIPPEVELKGTIRCFDAGLRQTLAGELERLVAAVAAALGAQTALEWFERLPPLVNNAEVLGEVRAVAREIVGETNLAAMRPVLGGEDMALILERVPGAFGFLGCGDPAIGATYSHHHPRFCLDERVLPLGVELLVRFARRVLRAG